MVYAKNTGGSWAVFAQKPMKQGDPVHILRPSSRRNEPTRTSIQIEEGLHIEDEVGQYINHSFNPTCEIDGFTVRALREGGLGEEITFDYTLNESLISSPFVCRDTGESVGDVTSEVPE